VVATGAPLMHDASRRRLADVLTALRHRVSLDEAGTCSPPTPSSACSRAALARRHPPEWLAETLAIAARCHFSPAELRYEYPRRSSRPGHARAHLRALVGQGCAGATRRPDGRSQVPPRSEQVEKELALIAELRYEAFFLTVEDIVRFARSRGILCQGRGSAANSVVCYALGVTEVDRRSQPALRALHLPRAQRAARHRRGFRARPARRSHPVHLRQIRPRPGRPGRHRDPLPPRSACATWAALGFDSGQLDQLVRRLAWWDGLRSPPSESAKPASTPTIRGSSCCSTGQRARRLSPPPVPARGRLRDLPGPLAELVPVENAAMEGRTVIQWDKDDLETLGLLKVDVLALGMLSAIRRSLALIGAGGGPSR
jgi:error-prone DNA polymerase